MSKITLRKLLEGDRANVYELLFSPSVMEFLGPRRPLSSDEAREWFDSEVGCPSRYVVAFEDTDELIGFCGVKKIDGALDFGYFLRKKYWGNGYATKACELALKKLAANTDLASIEIVIASTNSASQAVAKKLGWSNIQTATRNGEVGYLYAVNM